MLVIAALAIAIAAAALLGLYIRRRSQPPSELHENGWPEFERAFRAYAHQTATRSTTKE